MPDVTFKKILQFTVLQGLQSGTLICPKADKTCIGPEADVEAERIVQNSADVAQTSTEVISL